MHFKVFVVAATLAVALARPQEGHGHGHDFHHHVSSQHIQRHVVPGKAPAGHHDAHPKYEFKSEVEDPHTGDRKSQQESRDGDFVY